MSSKKSKAKNRQQKPSNPKPPQMKESADPAEKEIELKEEAIDRVKEVRVPEIESVAIPEKSEILESEAIDTPNKPKRNRGKKKKEKDDEHANAKSSDLVIEETKLAVDNIEDTQVLQKEVFEIVPTARKKKNKHKKNLEQPIEQGKPPNPDSLELQKTLPSLNKEEESIDTRLIQEANTSISEKNEQENKSLKKKNKKKKNRNDSEKSEKQEDVPVAETEKTELSVDLVPENKNDKIEEKEEAETQGSETPLIDDSSTSECTIKEVSVSIDKEEIIVEPLTEKGNEGNTLIVPSDDGSKGKKNKKDKKQILKEVKAVELLTTKTIQEFSTPKTELNTEACTVDFPVLSTGTVTEDKSFLLLSNIGPDENISEVEKSPKPKANIVKAVDKNDNIKLQTPEPTTQKDSISTDLPKEASHSTLIQSVIPMEGKVDLNKDVIEATQENENIQKQESQLIPAPQGGMGKKRKKSPKLPKQDFKQKIAEKVETLESNIENVEPEVRKTEELVSLNTGDMIASQMPSVSDVMQESTKSHESLDVAPDSVEYPRSNSEQPFDNNNNMIIQEVIIEQGKLEVPTDIPDTPFVQGSGETPILSPELIASGISVTEIEFNQFKGEKTDLKSKVIEVNQDMEELRLSIEKSLAELTAIEKCEEENEKQFEKTQDQKLPLTAITISEKSNKSDKSEPKEQIKDTTETKSIEIRPTEVIKMKNFPDSFTAVESEKPISEIIMESLKVKSDETHSTILPDVTGTSKTVDDNNKTVIKDEEEKPLKIDTALEFKTDQTKTEETLKLEKPVVADTTFTPVSPARRDHKGKGGKKKKDKHPRELTSSTSTTSSTEAASKCSSKEEKVEKTEQTSETTQEKGKQQSVTTEKDQADTQSKNKLEDERDQIRNDSTEEPILSCSPEFEPIENFEDALTSSVDDVNKSFEIIANEVNEANETNRLQQNPEISITESDEKDKNKSQEENKDVPQPKNLLGHKDIPVPSNKTDYKKEKNKTPNSRQAKVKIKDSTEIETADEKKKSKECQTKLKFPNDKTVKESISTVTNGNDEYIYKYSFRRVFLPSACHVCKKELKNSRVPCNFCNLIFYCCLKHRDEDVSEHQALCFAVSTIVHLKDQKHIYADAKDIEGHNYRLLRMQMIVSCEKVLKRKLVPWEQEALLYPRICADPSCREWKQNNLRDCEGCGQISYCSEYPDHFPKSHQRWCKSYCLYQKLVCYQQTKGRLEPKLPTRVMPHLYQIPEKINEVLASMYEEKIDMNDLQYAALTQLATAPLTAVYSYQLWNNKINTAKNALKKSSFTLHVVGAELQFEADALIKWEVFFLHLRSDINDLNVVLIAPDLNPSNLPLDLLGNIKLCENCKQNNRRIAFSFHDNMNYHEYWSSDYFATPDLVCAFNVSIQRSSSYNGKDPWPSTLACVLKTKSPLLVTSYTSHELHRDVARIKEICQKSDIHCTIVSEPKYNTYASVRPDRNFISDDEMPLLFKNYCFSIICG